jgi:hypothetical protein
VGLGSTEDRRPKTENPRPQPVGDAGIALSFAAFHGSMLFFLLLLLLSIVDAAALEAVFKMAAEPAKPHS